MPVHAVDLVIKELKRTPKVLTHNTIGVHENTMFFAPLKRRMTLGHEATIREVVARIALKRNLLGVVRTDGVSSGLHVTFYKHTRPNVRVSKYVNC
ncbi:MAG: hypothetical protein V1722_01320 [Candidatus Micrarchaeota archaeon]